MGGEPLWRSALRRREVRGEWAMAEIWFVSGYGFSRIGRTAYFETALAAATRRLKALFNLRRGAARLKARPDTKLLVRAARGELLAAARAVLAT